MNPIPDLLLERLALGELSPGERAALEQRLANDPAGRARLAEIERGNAAGALVRPHARVLAAARRARTRSHVRTVSLWAPALAALALVVGMGLRTESAPPSERLKGARPQLLLFQQQPHQAQPRLLGDGAVVFAHDLIQTGYVSAGRSYGVVVSVDGRGSVTLHSPQQPSQSARLPRGRTLLPRAFELDDAPDFERFIFVTSNQPIAPEHVLAAARDLARDPRVRTAELSLDHSLEQTSVLLVKGQTRP
jgi:hypothetical protein